MTILQLIHNYVSAVHSIAIALQQAFGVEDLLRASRQGVIPKRGTLRKSDLSYSFHGVGCSVTTPTITIDFDFGRNGKTGGFDAWRLLLYAKESNLGVAQRITEDEMRRELEHLEKQGLIYAPKEEPSPHLYYLV